MDKFFTVNELAEHFNVNPKTIYRLAEKDELPGNEIDGEWKFSKKEVFNVLYRNVDMEAKKREAKRSDRTLHKMNVLFLRGQFHSSVVSSLKKDIKGQRWEKFLGYGLEALKRRLKSTIPEGYTWNDFLSGQLEIDHIIPGSAFTIEDQRSLDFKRSWALGNLRLLPAVDNRKKGAKLLHPFQPGLNLKGACQ